MIRQICNRMIPHLLMILAWVPVTAQPAFDSLISLAGNMDDTSRIELYTRLSAEYSTSSLSRSLEYAEKALNESKAMNYQAGMANSLNRIGKVYADLKMYELAESHFLEALELRKAMNDLPAVASSYHILGFLNLELDSLDKAREFFIRSREINEMTGDPYLIGNSIRNMGEVCMHSNQVEEAIALFEQAIEKYSKAGRYRQMISCHDTLGYIYYRDQHLTKAMNEFRQSIDIANSHDNPELANNACLMMGKILMKRKEYASARQFLERSLKYSQESGNVEQQMKTNYSLYLLNRERGDLRSAYYSFWDYVNNKDMLAAARNQEAIVALNIRFDTRLRNDSIEMLRKNQMIEELRLIKNRDVWKYYIISFVFLVFLISIGVYRLWLKIMSNKLMNSKSVELSAINEQLVLSEHALQEVDMTKNKFFSVIAHDLINPFNALLNFTEFHLLELQKKSRQKTREYSNIIYQSAKNLNALLENLLEWSRAQADKIDHHPEMIELARFLSSIIAIQKISADKKNIRLLSRIPPGIKVYADANMLHTVLRNLIQNAIKFTGAQGMVEVEAYTRNPDVIIAVKDNGIGIAKERTDDLFRIDRHSTTRGTANEGGTGLGLIICREFVERNGGKLWVESEPGKGTTFSFSIPAHI